MLLCATQCMWGEDKWENEYKCWREEIPQKDGRGMWEWIEGWNVNEQQLKTNPNVKKWKWKKYKENEKDS